MALSIQNVNVLLHGLFFMTMESNDLVIHAPKITDHLFVGGVRGSRKELSGAIDFTGDLIGKDPSTGPPMITDVPGSIHQFIAAETGVGGLDLGHESKFLGHIILPWPKKFISIRDADVSTFPYVRTGTVGSKIELASRTTGGSQLGTGVLLRYTREAAGPFDCVLNIHFYLQPCKQHQISDVNNDLAEAANAFKTNLAFDLRLDERVKAPDPVPPKGDPDLGTAPEDEFSIPEELDAPPAPDLKAICDKHPPRPAPITPPGGALNPANCPTFFVG